MLVEAAERGRPQFVDAALAAGADIDATAGSLGNNALCAAASEGHRDIVLSLLERGADIHATGYADMTPLHLAARDGRLEVVQLLLSRGAPKSERVLSDVLQVAAMSVSGTEAIREVLRQKRIDMAKPSTGGDNATARLIASAHDGDVDRVVAALADGADTNARDSRGMEAMSWAALRGHTKIVDILAEHGADVNRPNRSGWPPIGQACGQGHPEVVRVLIARGADINQTFDGGRTPLMCAAFQGHEAVVAVLLEAGADAAARFQGQTAYGLAVLRGHTAIARRLSAPQSRG